jgi:hypothetical protein
MKFINKLKVVLHILLFVSLTTCEIMKNRTESQSSSLSAMLPKDFAGELLRQSLRTRTLET